MQWIQKALVAVDDSKAALHAFTEALRLSLSYGFRIEAVCAAPPYQGDLSLVGVKDWKPSRAEPCRTVLDEAVRMAEESGAGLATFAAEGDRLDAILHIAANRAHDLIILGQEPGIPWTSVGSLTSALLRHSPVDILVIPKDRRVRFNRVLRARNPPRSPSWRSPSLQDSGKTARKAPTDIAAAALHAAETAQAIFGQPSSTDPRQAFQSEKKPSEMLVCKASFRPLLKIARHIDADLIVWEQDGRREGWWTSLVGTTAYRLVRKSGCPVWIEKLPGGWSRTRRCSP